MEGVVKRRVTGRGRKETDFISFRSKGQDGDMSTCALGISNVLMQKLTSRTPHQDIIRLGLKALVPDEAGYLGLYAQELHVLPNESGFLVNYPKSTSKYGEVHIPWSSIPLKAPDASGKGRCRCQFYGTILVADISRWKLSDSGQDKLFQSWGTWILPRNR